VKLTIDDAEVPGVTSSGTHNLATFTYSGVLKAGRHAYVITVCDAAGMAAKPVKGSFTVKVAKSTAAILAAGVAGLAETDWLTD
jgi:hypothetical protein